MGKTITIEQLYHELKALKEDMEIVKHVLIPEEEIPAKELEEIRKIKKRWNPAKRSGLMKYLLSRNQSL